jgi:esterase/lipase
MKLALLLPGFLDSPDYLHMLTFEKGLERMGYVVERLDPCNLWKTKDTNNYTITNFIKQIKDRVDYYKKQNPEEIVLIGHSMGGFTAIVAGSKIEEVTKIVTLCPPPDRNHSVHKWGENGVRISKRDLPDKPNEFVEFAIPYSHVKDVLQYSAVEEAKKIHKPLMIFIALNDTVVLPVDTERIVKVANNPYVVRQPNMGHDFRFLKKECDIVFDEIKKFLER